jgi:hypothetical protein
MTTIVIRSPRVRRGMTAMVRKGGIAMVRRGMTAMVRKGVTATGPTLLFFRLVDGIGHVRVTCRHLTMGLQPGRR